MPQSNEKNGQGNGNYADLDYSGMHQFRDEETGDLYGSFEIFQGPEYSEITNPEDPGYLESRKWYWWSCFPGCLPDGDPCGPFDTSTEAYHDAQGF